MKRLFTIFATFAMLCAVGCEEQGGDDVTPNDKPGTEEPEEQKPENIFFGLDRESVSISPDGGSVDVVVYSNYKWEISGTSDWCTPSATSGKANEDGQKVTFSADVAYDTREAIFWFRCADEKIKFVVSQNLKEVIIADEHNTFSVPSEGGNVIINYQTTVECEVVIPEEAQSWISLAPATRALVSESATLTVAENTTYSERSAVIKVVAVDNKDLVVEYTINQVQNEAIIADGNNTFNVPSEGGVVEIAYQTNVECEIIIPEEAKSWISLTPATRALVNESATLTVAENTTYSARSAVIKVVKVDDNTLFAEYTINQEQNDAIIADENNIFNVPAEGGVVEVAYQTNVECKVVIPEEAQSWISLAPATRALVSESATLTVAENTTYSARSAVIKVVKVGDNTLFAEYTINQVQNDAIIADENNTFELSGIEQSINIAYRANVECEVVIPKESQSWISPAPATRALVKESVTLNIAENNTGAERSAVVKVVAANNKELVAEYTITQNQRYFIEYTSANGSTIAPYDRNAFGATFLRNKYIDGKGYIDFNAPITSIGSNAFYGRSSLKSITIPDSVTSIGDNAFYNCSSLKSITIPDSVTSIGGYAFYGCTSLTSITIPDSVTSIGEYAFDGCKWLKSITIPDSVTEIGEGAFYNCSSLTSITIPDSVTSIGEGAFYNCSSLTSITIPDSVTSIGEGTFKGCSSLTSITIPDSVTLIGEGAFYGCKWLKSITIPNSVTSIGEGAFYNCSSLTSITIGNSVTSIGRYAFYNCTSLTSITIPDSVTSIGYYAFYGCTGELIINSKIVATNYTSDSYPYKTGWLCGAKFSKLTIGNGVTKIGAYTFYDCTSLTSVTIPDSITSIGAYAFYDCTSLKSVHITDIAAWCGIIFGGYDANPLRYAHNLYFNGELATNLVIPDSVTSIGDYAFYNCSSLTSITIPDSVTSIGNSAFYSCAGELIINSKIVETNYTSDSYPDKTGGWLYGANFSKLTIGNGVTKIGAYAFYDRTSLTSITIPDSVTSIGNYAFYGCYSLTSVTIPDSVTSIGSSAFYDCDSLKRVTIGNGVTSIGYRAFYECSSLTSITIPDSVASIGGSAFCYCSSLKSVTIGNGVTSIGEDAFQYCTSLKSITIGNGVTSIGEDAFYGCSSLTSVTIGNGVTSIGYRAFYKCTSLTNITIPDSVTSIGGYAFYDCTSLTSVYCKPSTPPTAEYNSYWGAFDHNASGRKIYVPRASVNAYKSARYWSDYKSSIEGYDFE